MNPLRSAPNFTHLILRVPLVCLCTSMPDFSVFGSERVEAYWGSFGERSGRIEGAFLKTANSGIFIGFDEESELGAFSSQVDWNSEGDFVFGGLAKFKGSDFLVPTAGVGRALTEGTDVILESGFVDSDLRFESFVRTSAQLERYSLEGEIDGELYLVLGENDLSYALFIDHSGSIFGGTLQYDEISGLLSFRSQKGDRFEFQTSSLSPRYVLADGRRGGLLQVANENQVDVDTSSIYLRKAWNSYVKSSQSPQDGLHFIIEGEGSMPVEILAELSIDIRSVFDWETLNSISIELYQLDENNEWRMLFPSLPLMRSKNPDEPEFSLSFSGRLDATLPSGTYLANLSNIFSLSAEIATQAHFAHSNDIFVVNGSTFYHRDSRNLDHHFGFDLAGEGVIQALVRSVGPGLAYFDVSECTENPNLSVYQHGLKSWKNDDWAIAENFEKSSVMGNRLGAFPLSENSKDSALSLSLGPGSYSVESRRGTDDAGFEIIELYLQTE